ncbi:hypothetical protein DFJ73DRAFT_820836 [Zopfochytrium polystomum]|nr:hypothetical protein DFJ73DRAFT_820836 [Zopfochytrium polystomum]
MSGSDGGEFLELPRAEASIAAVDDTEFYANENVDDEDEIIDDYQDMQDVFGMDVDTAVFGLRRGRGDNDEDLDRDEDEDPDGADEDLSRIPEEIGVMMETAALDIDGVKSIRREIWDSMGAYVEDEEGYDDVLEDGTGDMELLMEPGSGLWDGTSRRKGKKKGRSRQKIPPEVSAMIGQATIAYAQKDLDEAFRLLREVIKANMKLPDPWRMLGVMYEETGDEVKALQANFVAAHLNPQDSDLWIRLAKTSRERGKINDVLYCLLKATSAKPEDPSPWYEIAMIYIDSKRYKKAMDALQSLLKFNHHFMPAVKELASIYIILKEPQSAFDLYKDALDADFTLPLPDEPVTQIGQGLENEDIFEIGTLTGVIHMKGQYRVQLPELRILIQLCHELKQHDSVVTVVETFVACRRNNLLRRRGEPIAPLPEDWDLDTDGPVGSLPIDVIIDLGVSRLWQDDAEVARHHFQVLKEIAVGAFPHLFQTVAEAYLAKRMFAQALTMYQQMNENESTDAASTWVGMANCLLNMGNLHDAAELYTSALEVEPQNNDWKLQLAEVYNALGETEKSTKLTDEVNKAAVSQAVSEYEPSPYHRRKLSKAGVRFGRRPRAEYKGKEHAGRDDDALVVAPKTRRVPEEDPAAIVAQERETLRDNSELWTRMLGLAEFMHDHIKRVDFLRSARKLIVKFLSCKHLYPARKYAPPPRRKDLPENTALLTEDSFGGITFTQWFEAFSMYGLALTLDGKEEDAYSALTSAMDSNIFYHSDKWRIQIQLQMIASAIYCGNFARVVEVCRFLLGRYKEENDIYRFYCAVLQGGTTAVSAFASAISYKYFLKQVKVFEKKLAKDPKNLANRSPVLWALYGHIMMCGRSYASAVQYYGEAVKAAPNDPMLNLSIGLGYLHWAMQRRVDNRHLRVVQAFTFLFRYSELLGSNQEALYNIGRALHQLGLVHLAVGYYEQVLEKSKEMEDPTVDLKAEAAYNLALIHVASGSSAVAQRLLYEHIVVGSAEEDEMDEIEGLVDGEGDEEVDETVGLTSA